MKCNVHVRNQLSGNLPRDRPSMAKCTFYTLQRFFTIFFFFVSCPVPGQFEYHFMMSNPFRSVWIHIELLHLMWRMHTEFDQGKLRSSDQFNGLYLEPIFIQSTTFRFWSNAKCPIKIQQMNDGNLSRNCAWDKTCLIFARFMSTMLTIFKIRPNLGALFNASSKLMNENRNVDCQGPKLWVELLVVYSANWTTTK